MVVVVVGMGRGLGMGMGMGAGCRGGSSWREEGREVLAGGWVGMETGSSEGEGEG